MDKKTELLKKLKALAERGVNGEKENAAALLKKLMDKYDISSEELNIDVVKEEQFTFHGAEQRRILLQIIYKVANDKDIFHEYKYTASGRSCRTVVGADVTKAQKIEIEFLFDFYVKQWEKEKERFLSAYIQKHELYGELKPGERATEQSLEELGKSSVLQQAMDNVSPIRRIEAKNE